MASTIPQGPWYNPEIEGVYEAKLTDIKKGKYGTEDSTYHQLVFWLSGPKKYAVTNFYLPKGKPDCRTVKRIGGLCNALGGTPQDFIDCPRSYIGQGLKIKMTRYENPQPYCDVEIFLRWDAVIEPDEDGDPEAGVSQE